jgi:hypothetical protein
MEYSLYAHLFQELERARAQNAVSGGATMDLLSYLEFQSNIKEATKYHAMAIKAIKAFWGLLAKVNSTIHFALG